MNQCDIYCVSTEKSAIADILERSDKRIKVVMIGTKIPITLTRKDTRYPYTGTEFGLEFETFGEME